MPRELPRSCRGAGALTDSLKIVYSENIITIFWRYNNPAPTLRKENLIFKALKWKSTFHQKIDDRLVNTVQIPLFRWKAHKERIHLRVFSTWGIGQRGHMRSTFSKNMKKENVIRKMSEIWYPDFFSFGLCRPSGSCGSIRLVKLVWTLLVWASQVPPKP